MEPIPEVIVDKTWQEVAGFSPDRAKKEMIKIGNSQPELLAFITEEAREMGGEVRELAIYMFLVVYRICFKRPMGRSKRFLLRETIECYEQNDGLMERLEGADEKFLDRITSVQTSRQPYVVKYVVDALMRIMTARSCALTEEPKGFLFMLLKTVRRGISIVCIVF